MKSQFTNLNTVVPRSLSFVGIAVIVLLLATLLFNKAPIKPGSTQSLGAVPYPAETILAPVDMPTAPVTGNTPTTTVIEGMPTTPVTHVRQTAEPTPSELLPDEVINRDFGVWSYKAGRLRNVGASVVINYDTDTVASLHAFAEANRVLASTLATSGGQSEVYVTFRTYITPQQFRTWATSHNASVDRTMLRTVDPAGQLGILGQGSLPSDIEPLPQSRLDAALTMTLGARGTYTLTLRGLYYTLITVDSSRLPEIASDPLVFIANVTPNIVRSDLAAAGWQLQPTSLGVNPPSPFYKMEQLGLENFAH